MLTEVNQKIEKKEIRNLAFETFSFSNNLKFTIYNISSSIRIIGTAKQ